MLIELNTTCDWIIGNIWRFGHLDSTFGEKLTTFGLFDFKVGKPRINFFKEKIVKFVNYLKLSESFIEQINFLFYAKCRKKLQHSFCFS